MNKHDEFPTKPNYQDLYEAVSKENEILTELKGLLEVKLASKETQLNELTQGVKDAIEVLHKSKLSCHKVNSVFEEYKAHGICFCIDILTEKTGISA